MSTQPDKPERRGIGGWILQHPKSMLALAILLLFALAILGLSHSAESRLAARIAAIKSKGEPTTIQDLLALQRRLPDDKNRAVAVVKIGTKIQSVKLTTEQSNHLPYQGGAMNLQTGVRWPAKRIETAQRYLTQIEHDLTDLRKVMKLAESSFCIPWSSPTFNVIPSLSPVRACAKVLPLSAESVAMLGDRERAGQCVVDALGMLDATNGGHSILCDLVQIAINSLVYDMCERVVNQCGLDKATLKKVEVALREAEGSMDLKKSLMTERVMFLDTVLWLRANKSQSGSSLGAPNLNSFSLATVWAYLPAVPAMDAIQGLVFYDAMIEAVNGPNLDSIRRATVADAILANLPWYSIISKMSGGSYSRSVALWVRHTGQSRALRVAIAAERYRLAHNQWPVDSAALVPTFIDAIPPDPIDGKPIRYAIIPEGIKTWTISDDADNRDNGGDVQRIETGNNKHRPTDFGWVILNPELRGRQESAPTPTTQSAAPTKSPNARRN